MPEALANIDWQALFVPSVPVLETIIRGTLVYLALFALLRLVLKREAGALGVTDLLVVVLIADAAQNAMANDYRSIPDGILLVATIILWSYALDWLSYRSPRFARLIQPAPLLLVQDGVMLRRNLRRELITEDELMSSLRRQGVADLSEVRRAYMEPDGRISVLRRSEDQQRDEEERRTF